MKKRVAWNKGLTKETDKRVKKNSEAHIGNTNVKGRKYIYNKELDKQRMVYPKELPKYFDLGYKLGKRPFSEEHKQNMKKARAGLKFSEEHKQNMSESQKKLKYIYNEELDKEKNVIEEKLPKYLKIGYRLGRRLHSKETKHKMRLTHIKRIQESIKNGAQLTPGYNLKGCKYFNILMKQTNTYIQHAENGGEFHIKELSYWVDGYDKENNIVYEYDEAKHYNIDGTLKEKDIKRQEEITELLNCEFIRIKASKV